MKNHWSVRKLLAFTLRSGDIDTGFLSHKRALEGIRLHQKLQRAYPPSFETEVEIAGTVAYDGGEIVLEGRIDGLDGDVPLLDEIKSTVYTKAAIDARPDELHWAQLKCYGYLYAKERGLDTMHLRLTYIRIEDESVFRYDKIASIDELNDFMNEVMTRFQRIQKRLNDFRILSVQSAKDLKFPFDDFRPGQRDMAVAVYNMILTKGTLLIQAPTGIGKTLATLFSAVKAIGEGILDGVFYATGRSTQKAIAADTLSMLAGAGLRMKSTELVAKEKACLNDEVACTPERCAYAKGHYDRLIDGIVDIFDHEDLFDRQTVAHYAEKHRLCPFEYSLDLSNLSNILIGDYNYVFHPKSYLERLLEDRDRLSRTCLLVDEAHNVIDRGRDMYSGHLDVRTIDNIDYPTEKLRTFADLFIRQLRLVTSVEGATFVELRDDFIEAVEDLTDAMATYLARLSAEPDDDFLELYFRLLDWQNLNLFYDARYFTFFVPQKETLALLCLDPSAVLSARRQLFRSTVYFSATLSPMDYHRYCLGAGDDAKAMTLKSPFDPAHLLVLHPPHLSTRYKDRTRNLHEVSRYLKAFTRTHPGNFIHFFPSYAYKDQVVQATEDWEENGHDQARFMTEKERANYIARFRKCKPVHGYSVMGGAFSEGVDLSGDALLGVSILTLSLPGLSRERELIKERFNQSGKDGYAYAYTYPGLTKVVQAAGRIIRSDTDRGQLLLLDDRYLRPDIRALLPDYWNITVVHSVEDMKEKIEAFWR
ncbi:MAG: helicase C-terminal domain-containing protein [Peptoniphilus sp.]|nr:helicase C-terminal domain-containing protein [Peptoniphilus sp.]MDY3118436.1 helicase C-terminal domain-containing protein [Peptoniphilus sp.]